MKKKILITGINGFLGSHLAKQLKLNFEVLGLEYSLENLHRIKSDNFKVYSTNDCSLESIFIENEIYAVVHVATVYRRQDEPIFNLLNTNINLPVKLLEICNKNNVSMFLNTDSFFNNSSYSYSYLSDYTLSKKHALDWIKLMANSSGCKVVNMKVFHMFGDNDAPGKFISFIVEKIKKNTVFLEMTKGEQTRDFIYVKDVVSAFNCVLNSFLSLETYQEYEIGQGKSYSIREIAELIKGITDSKTELRFGAIPYRDGEIMESISDISSLLDLKWKPNYTLETGLKDYLLN